VLNLWGGDVLLAPHISPLHRIKPVLGLKAADCIIGDSRYLVESAIRLVPKRCTRVIPWGVEARYLALHKKDYQFSSPLRIIVPRRQEKLYNNPFIIEALADLLREGRIEVTFQGYGELADEFRRRAEQVTDRGVLYYEQMGRAEFLPFVAEHDVYLSAASTDSSPASLIEAMALGLIPIAADIPGVREWLNSDTGFLYRQHDAAHLRGIVSDLVRRRDPLEQMRRTNVERVRREAVFEYNVAQQLGLMRELASRRQR
jgi:glycosyltransferase involved in cell wall biosynthesis